MRSMPMDSGPNVVNAVVLIFTLISGLAVLLRLFMRGIVLRKASVEDVWITLAMVSSYIACSPPSANEV
jgi:hypothetical protein